MLDEECCLLQQMILEIVLQLQHVGLAARQRQLQLLQQQQLQLHKKSAAVTRTRVHQLAQPMESSSRALRIGMIQQRHL